eukprot:788680_1
MASERAERLRERNSNKKKAEEEEKKREPNKPNKPNRSWFKKGHKLNAHPDPAGYESRDKRYRYERYQDNRKRENQGDLAREKRLETWWQHKKQQESIDKAKRARKPKPFHNKECDLTLQSNKRIPNSPWFFRIFQLRDRRRNLFKNVTSKDNSKTSHVPCIFPRKNVSQSDWIEDFQIRNGI